MGGRPGVPEIGRLARTITTWRTEFLAYFSTGRISNGPTEAVNLSIKKILRVAHGFRNFDNCRLRLLLHRGITWHHQTPTSTTRSATTLGCAEPDYFRHGSDGRGIVIDLRPDGLIDAQDRPFRRSGPVG